MKRERIKYLENIIPDILNRCEIPGLSFGIIHKDELVYSAGFGKASISSNKKIDNNTVYSLGSLTKSFTACGAVLLDQRNIINLDLPIINYYKSLVLKDEDLAKKITFIDLLTHRTGYPRNDQFWAFSTKSRLELINDLKNLDTTQELRSSFIYNNHMYMLAGFLIELIENKTWEKFILDNFLLPLNMCSTGNLNLLKNIDNYASAHQFKDGKLIEFNEFGFGACAPAGSLVSNISDLSKWISLFIQKGEFEGQKILSNSSYQKIFKPYIKSHSKTFSNFKEFDQEFYGLGWRIQKFKNENIFWHGGGTEGFTSFMGIIPEKNYGIIVLANSIKQSIDKDGASIVACYLLDLILSSEFDNWDRKFSDM